MRIVHTIIYWGYFMLMSGYWKPFLIGLVMGAGLMWLVFQL